MSTQLQQSKALTVSVRQMRKDDVAVASSIMQSAFATFLGAPDPNTFWDDRDYVGTRWATDPNAALVAEADGVLVGSNFATSWGSFGFFGPLTVRPELWNQGIAQRLLGPTMELLQSWGVRQTGLFTFAQSPRHVNLYQKFGFWPRFLTAIMSKRASRRTGSAWSAYSKLGESERMQVLNACREVTGSIFEGLDLSTEIRAVHGQQLGDTVLIWSGDTLQAFAICHCGAGTEGGRNTCYIKFGAVRAASGAEQRFDTLLEACESLAAGRGLERIEAGVNLGRGQAYRRMLARGFRTDVQGVAMQKPDAPAYNRPEVYVIDDWR